MDGGGGKDVPVTRTGRLQRDALDLDAYGTGVGEVSSDPERLARDSGGEGILRVGCESGAATVRRGRSHHCVERDAERLNDGAVELRLLHRELMVDVVFFFG